MNTVRHLTALALLAALFLVPSAALAQTGADSDTLSETVIDLSTGGAVPLLAPPPVFVPIPETPTAEPPLPVPMPAREIDFLEPIGTAQFISDRLSISPYEMQVQSDDEGNLPRRTNATLIPASAFESFQPIRIDARSDGDVTGTTQESDTLTVTVGYFGPGTGTVVFTGTIPEPLPEGTTEPVLGVAIPPTFFDIEELPIETGGVLGKISDYADILSTIQVRFISSDDQAVYLNLPAANGSVFESFQTGGGVVYAVEFRSDAVPEPASFALLGIAMLASASFGSRRQRR
jgi:hypothetical protein